MTAGKNKPNLKTYVVCSGIVYGYGEDSLYDIIEVLADLQRPHIKARTL
jgi:lipoate synthase